MRDDGGKPRILVAVSSLSPRAQQEDENQQALPIKKALIEKRTNEDKPPWYMEIGQRYLAYIQKHRAEFDAAHELATKLKPLLQLAGKEKSAAVNRVAKKLGTLYRNLRELKEAHYWAEKRHLEDGQGHEPYLMAMALCRKPKPKNTFPGLSPDLSW